MSAFSLRMSAGGDGNANVATSTNRIIFGTAAISNAKDPFGLLDAAYEKGFRRFDLARTYGGGASEKLMGEWMAARNVDRSDLNLITKGGMGDDKYGDPERPILTRAVLRSEIECSLETLGTDYVDLYMYHRDDPRIPVGELVTWANEEVVAVGKTVGGWGVSNWSFDRFVEAYDFALAHGLQPPTANSPQLSLATPRCDIWPTTYSIAGTGPEQKSQLQWYGERDVELVCWEVLAKGFMANPELWPEDSVDTAVFGDDLTSDKTLAEIGTNEWRLQRIQRAYCHPENYRRRSAAVKVAQRNGLQLAQIATLFALSVADNVSVTVGFLEASQLDDMVGLQDRFFDKECVISGTYNGSWDDCVRDNDVLLLERLESVLVK